jgi:hypothetical protein
MATPGTPIFDPARREWRVAVLGRTANAILPVGEFLLDEDANIIAIPSKEPMLRVLEAQVERLPYLVYGDREELERHGAHVVSL